MIKTIIIPNVIYDKIAQHEPGASDTELFSNIERWPYVYDTVDLASLSNNSLDLDIKKLYVDINTDFDAQYEKVLSWQEDSYHGISVNSLSEVGFKTDHERFLNLHVDLPRKAGLCRSTLELDGFYATNIDSLARIATYHHLAAVSKSPLHHPFADVRGKHDAIRSHSL